MQEAFGLLPDEFAALRALTTPIKIQNFLDGLAINHEKENETCYSPRSVLREQKAHCIEGALLAATVLWLHGERPLLLELAVARGDQDHAVALYKRNGYWGAISKTNHTSLRFRDPIYRNVRELVLSYFHEYFIQSSGTKSLRAYTRPFSLKRFGKGWITSETDLWHIAYALHDAPHFSVIPKGSEPYIRSADTMERKGGALIEWKATHPRT